MTAARDYGLHWDDKFKAREWGRYPPEDLVRFMGRNFRDRAQRNMIRVLEVGCGPGANLWFLHREGFRVAGIDGSPAAIERAASRLAVENAGLNPVAPDLRVGDISVLPWADASFDVVIDIFAIYANPLAVIDRAVAEVSRVLKPGGRFYMKAWGAQTTGYGTGRQLEEGTFVDIPVGPCRDMGVAHFFTESEIRARFAAFTIDAIDQQLRSDAIIDSNIEELLCQFTRRSDA